MIRLPTFVTVFQQLLNRITPVSVCNQFTQEVQSGNQLEIVLTSWLICRLQILESIELVRLELRLGLL